MDVLMNLYKERDIDELDEKGNFYINHVSAMTSEKLHSKSAIAAELGHRDMRIQELVKMCNEQAHRIRELKEVIKEIVFLLEPGGDPHLQDSIVEEAYTAAKNVLSGAK